jgi:hypothetical protein
MIMTMEENNRIFLNRRIAAKGEELAKVEADLDEAMTGDVELKLSRKAERLLKEIQELYSKLSELDKNSSNPDTRHLNLEKSFQKIDFSESRKIAQSLKEQYEIEGGAILLFLQKSKKQLGKYCIEEFIDVIMSNQIETCPRRTINFESTTYKSNKYGFINAISGYLGIEISSCLEDDENRLFSIINEIHEKIVSSLSLGDTIFFEIKSINRLEDKEEFIEWFIKIFWQPLINRNKSLFNQKRNRLIFALIAESPFPINSSNFCQEVTLNHDKMIEIPLLDWTVEDISNWLISHHKLFPRFANVQDCHEIHKEAKNIHEESEGTPESVCSKLQEYFYGKN